MPPGRKVTIVACMDARLDVDRMLGLTEGEVHVIRNAGGIISPDVERTLAISQRLLGTREIVLIHHTDCGMPTFRDGVRGGGGSDQSPEGAGGSGPAIVPRRMIPGAASIRSCPGAVVS